jgi:hypothetical protein
MRRPVIFAAAMLLFYRAAAAADDPVLRGSLRLPVPARTLAAALGLASSDASTLMLHAVRLLHDTPAAAGSPGRRVRDSVEDLLTKPGERTTDVVPLPLDPAIWRDTLLQAPVGPDELASAILRDRRAALLYYGLAALDDETLAWLGSERDILLEARKRPAIFAAFGRSLHIRGGRVAVPGGGEAEPLWRSLTGVDPGQPARFVARVLNGDSRLALLYDTIRHAAVRAASLRRLDRAGSGTDGYGVTRLRGFSGVDDFAGTHRHHGARRVRPRREARRQAEYDRGGPASWDIHRRISVRAGGHRTGAAVRCPGCGARGEPRRRGASVARG